ncbi:MULTISPECIES: helix-turn-helix transcriptional regulator [Bradyrhizobium]|uniref:helix-turn-helix domain-containing protein n=1 Tax=Bradyrhizobium TaxID=374 RepID=UPI000A92267C|nr:MULTISPECIES: helix-turn-helix transcriptional regulator [Bradyrhizobium]MDH2380751.1 helix-turn-helix transcriptional regulator [Bradyrhizobium sp. CER78]
MIVITRQIRAARSLLGWEQYELAVQSGVAISTVRRLEGSKRAVNVQSDTIEKIRLACERAGIEFIGLPNPGVRLRTGDRALPADLQQVVICSFAMHASAL